MIKKALRSATFWIVFITILICLQDAFYDNAQFVNEQHLTLFLLDPIYNTLIDHEPYRSIIFQNGPSFLKITPIGYLIKTGISIVYGLLLDVVIFIIRDWYKNSRKEFSR